MVRVVNEVMADMRSVFENWADYCSVKWRSWFWGSPDLLCCFKKYSHLLYFEIIITVNAHSLLKYYLTHFFCEVTHNFICRLS